jgi:hypothetical protein
MGLFAVEPIAAGTRTWQFVESFDSVYSIEEFGKLSTDHKIAIQHFGYCVQDGMKWVLCGDGALFMNHSVTPNTEPAYETGPYGEDVAARDIAAGEELTCDYRLWDLDFMSKIFFEGLAE